MTTVLDRIVATTRAEVDRRRRDHPLEDAPPTRDTRKGCFREALSGPGLSVIAEYKRRSPSAGPIGRGASVAEVVGAYERGGAAAVSVLTEGPHFGGTLDDLRAARIACQLPLLRKDFMIDSYQLVEALLSGADAVLLIVAVLDQVTLELLHGEATNLGLDVLVEVHDTAELVRAQAAGARIIGVNNRDLRDMSVDTRRTLDLLEAIGPDVVVVSESGLGSPEQLAELDGAGVHGVLIGEALMGAPDPGAALRQLLA